MHPSVSRIRLTPQVAVQDFLAIVGSILVLVLFDKIGSRKLHPGARWFFVHAVANFIVVITSILDAVDALNDPVQSTEGDYSLFPIYVVAAIHLYHVIAFDNLRREDWVHHIVFGGVICTLGLTFRTGPILGLICFFVCGLPGLLDYVMLVMVKQGLMDVTMEKRYNSRIMTWLRGPGCVIIAYICHMSWKLNRTDLSIWEELALLAVGALVYTNGVFYAQQVVGNAYLKDETINKIGC